MALLPDATAIDASAEPPAEPPTEPLDKLPDSTPAEDRGTNPGYVPPPMPHGVPPVVPPHGMTQAPPEKASPFQRKRFHFTTGLRAGLPAQVRDDDGNVLLTYRSFASVVGIVAALMSAIVLVAGIAAVLFLAKEDRPIPAALALALSVGFALLIAMLVPRTHVTLHNDNALVLTIAQISRAAFPSATFAVATPDGRVLALLRKSFLSRLGRNRWAILDPDTRRTTGYAIEESLGRAYRRKLLAKFSRRHDANVRVRYEASDVATIVRKPDEKARVDVLELSSDALDARVAVGLALLVLASEP